MERTEQVRGHRAPSVRPLAGSAGALRHLHDNFTERTWMGVVMGEEVNKPMKTYVQYPPRKVQSYGYTGPITLSQYERFQWIREQPQKEGVNLHLATGNGRVTMRPRARRKRARGLRPL